MAAGIRPLKHDEICPHCKSDTQHETLYPWEGSFLCKLHWRKLFDAWK